MPRSYAFRRGPKPAAYRPDLKRYESEKRDWVERHPRATPAEYAEAMRTLASRCGI